MKHKTRFIDPEIVKWQAGYRPGDPLNPAIWAPLSQMWPDIAAMLHIGRGEVYDRVRRLSVPFSTVHHRGRYYVCLPSWNEWVRYMGAIKAGEYDAEWPSTI